MLNTKVQASNLPAIAKVQASNLPAIVWIKKNSSTLKKCSFIIVEISFEAKRK
jgi:hypothetical protein